LRIFTNYLSANWDPVKVAHRLRTNETTVYNFLPSSIFKEGRWTSTLIRKSELLLESGFDRKSKLSKRCNIKSYFYKSLLTSWGSRPVVPGCAGCAMAHPDFVRSVNPISTRGNGLCPPNYYWHTRIFRPSDGPDVLSFKELFLY
jgi:hypothetical protein